MSKNEKITTLQKLANYMLYVINTYPNGCAAHNWVIHEYYEILMGKRLPEEYEVEHIIEDCLNEFHDDLGLCGCGIPEETHEVIRRVLNTQSLNVQSLDDWKEKNKLFGEICDANMDNKNYRGLIQFVLYILNNKEFLEHGSSVDGSWLTEKGKIYLDLLNMWHDLKDDN